MSMDIFGSVLFLYTYLLLMKKQSVWRITFPAPYLLLQMSCRCMKLFRAQGCIAAQPTEALQLQR